MFWLTWPPPRKVSAGLLEPWPCSGQALGLLPAGARTQLSPPCLCPPGGPLSSEPLGGWGLRTVSTAARLAHTAWSAAPTRAVGLKRHTSALSENASVLVFQEAEAFALYHKALDLQKHDRFEESAKAYHELLEARLLREVSAPGFPMCGTPSLLRCSKVGRVQRRASQSASCGALSALSVEAAVWMAQGLLFWEAAEHTCCGRRRLRSGPRVCRACRARPLPVLLPRWPANCVPGVWPLSSVCSELRWGWGCP